MEEQNRKNSDSTQQRLAKQAVFDKIEQWLNVSLEHKPKILVGKTYMQPDFYSKEDGIIGFIVVHIGKLKAGQKEKLSQHILRMLLIEKLEGRAYRKMIVVSDQPVKEQIEGDSILAECISQFQIEVKIMPMEAELRERLLTAQKKQVMVNA